jgi:hypothetical protein
MKREILDNRVSITLYLVSATTATIAVFLFDVGFKEIEVAACARWAFEGLCLSLASGTGIGVAMLGIKRRAN